MGRCRARSQAVAGVAVVVLGLGMVAAGCLPASPPPPPLSITTNPGLFPAFSPGVSDYVIRCDANTPVTVSVTAPPGTSVSVNNQPAGSGTFAVGVTRDVGQSFTIVVQRPSQAPSTYYARCLPSDFPTWTVQKSGNTQAEYYVTVPWAGFTNYPAIFDTDGVPIWWAPKTTT